MKNFIVLAFMLVMFSISCSSPPDSSPTQYTLTSISVLSSDMAIQAPVMFAVDDVTPAVPPEDNSPAYLLTSIAGILVTVYEIVVRLIPTAKSISALGFIYKFLSAIIPDRSQNGGTFRIRDKL